METEDIIKLIVGIVLILIAISMIYVLSFTEVTSILSSVSCLVGITLILFSFDSIETKILNLFV